MVGGVEKAPWAARGTQLPLDIMHLHSILQGRVTLQQGSATLVYVGTSWTVGLIWNWSFAFLRMSTGY